MQLIINIEKGHLYFVIALVCVFFVAGVSAFTSPSGVGHTDEEIESVSSEKVKSGIFGQDVGGGDYVFPSNILVLGNAKGIFWGSSPSPGIPHVDYSSFTGLWISTGTTGSQIYFEGGDVVVNDNRLWVPTLCLGRVCRTNWPSAAATTWLPASKIQGGTFGASVGGSDDYNFPGDVTVNSDVTVNNDLKVPSGGLCVDSDGGCAPLSGGIRIGNGGGDLRVEGGDICFGSDCRNSWPNVPSGTCGSGKVMTGIDSSGNIICKSPALDCHRRNCSGCEQMDCPSGYIAVGGGYRDTSGKDDDTDMDRPKSGLSGWEVSDEGRTETYVVCCKLTIS